MKTLTARAAAERIKDDVQLVWLVEVDADEPDSGTTTQYWASRTFTLEGQAYVDVFNLDGIRPGRTRIRPNGGLVEVGGLELDVNNLEKASNLIDQFFLENDAVRLYLLFVDGGSEEIVDKVGIMRGVIENMGIDIRSWTLDIIDGTDRLFREIPAERINLIDYPFAPIDAQGQVVPVPFGNLNVGPYDGAGAAPLMAPCRNLDLFTQQYTSGLQADSYGAVYQYYSQAKRYAECLNITQTGGTFTVDDPTRMLWLRPILPLGTNTVTDWYTAADGDHSAGATVGVGNDLDMRLGGVPKLGSLTAITCEILATGTYGYTIKRGATTLASNASVSGNQSVALDETDWATDWDFERVTIEIDGTAGNPEIKQVYLDLRYDDQQSIDGQSLALFQKVVGWEDKAAYYEDGAVVSSDGVALTNPAHQLEAALRGQCLIRRPIADLNLSALDAAASARTGWQFAFSLDQAVNLPWLSEFCFQAGFHLLPDHLGTLKVVAQDKAAAPVDTFLGNHNIVVNNPDEQDPGEWVEGLRLGKTPMRDILNEIAIRYRKDRASGAYTGLKVASGRFRVTNEADPSGASIDGAAGILPDTNAQFVTDNVKVGDSIYALDGQSLTVDAINSETALAVSAPVGSSVHDASAPLTYWIGPSLDGRLKRSQLRYKTENALGQRQSTFTDVGGYPSDFIVDDTTATNLLEHLIEWRANRRLIASFAAVWHAVHLEPGDLVLLDHGWLPPGKRPQQLTTVNEAIDASETVWDVPSGDAGYFRDNDYLLIDEEVVQVDSVDTGADQLTVTRGAVDTEAATHATAAPLKRFAVKWELAGIQAVPGRAQFRIDLQEVPNDYLPIGVCVADGHNGYSAATDQERAQAGWCVRNSGLMIEEDIDSAVSHAGAD